MPIAHSQQTTIQNWFKSLSYWIRFPLRMSTLTYLLLIIESAKAISGRSNHEWRYYKDITAYLIDNPVPGLAITPSVYATMVSQYHTAINNNDGSAVYESLDQFIAAVPFAAAVPFLEDKVMLAFRYEDFDIVNEASQRLLQIDSNSEIAAAGMIVTKLVNGHYSLADLQPYQSILGAEPETFIGNCARLGILFIQATESLKYQDFLAINAQVRKINTIGDLFNDFHELIQKLNKRYENTRFLMANQMLLDYEEAKERKDYQLAIQQLEKLIEIFPNDKHYYELLLGYALGLKDPKINEYATRLLQVDPHNQIASFALLMKENNWADPQRVLELKNLFENLSPDSNDPFVQRARAIFLINMATLPPNLELMDSVLNEFAGFENDADLGPKFKTMRQLRNVMIEFKQLPDFSNAVNSFCPMPFHREVLPNLLGIKQRNIFSEEVLLDAYQHSLGLILAKNTHLPILSVNTPTASYYQYNLPVLTRNQNAKLYQYGLVGYYDLGYNSANCTLEYHGPLDTEFALKDLRREVIAILTPDGQLIRTSEDYEVKVIQKRLHEEEIKKQEMLRQAKENELLDQYRTLVNQGNFAEAYPVERHILANGLSSANTIANILIVQMEYQLATGNKNNINYYANHFESLPDASDSYEINYAKGLYLTNELGAEPGSIAIATANNFLRKAKALNPQCIKCEEYIAYNKSKLPQDNVGLYALGATVLSGIFGIGWLWKKNHSAAKPTRIVTEDPKKPRGLSPEEEQEIQARMMQDLQSSMSKMEDTLKPLGDAKVVYENEMVLIELNLKATIASADFEDIKNKCPFASLTIDKKYLLEIMVRHFSGFKDVKIVDDKIYIKDRLANLAGVNLVSSLQSAIKDAVAAAPEMQAQEKYEEAVAKLAQIPAIDELECQWQFLSNWTKNNETTIKENYISDNDKKKTEIFALEVEANKKLTALKTAHQGLLEIIKANASVKFENIEQLNERRRQLNAFFVQYEKTRSSADREITKFSNVKDRVCDALTGHFIINNEFLVAGPDDEEEEGSTISNDNNQEVSANSNNLVDENEDVIDLDALLYFPTAHSSEPEIIPANRLVNRPTEKPATKNNNNYDIGANLQRATYLNQRLESIAREPRISVIKEIFSYRKEIFDLTHSPQQTALYKLCSDDPAVLSALMQNLPVILHNMRAFSLQRCMHALGQVVRPGQKLDGYAKSRVLYRHKNFIKKHALWLQYEHPELLTQAYHDFTPSKFAEWLRNIAKNSPTPLQLTRGLFSSRAVKNALAIKSHKNDLIHKYIQDQFIIIDALAKIAQHLQGKNCYLESALMRGLLSASILQLGQGLSLLRRIDKLGYEAYRASVKKPLLFKLEGKDNIIDLLVEMRNCLRHHYKEKITKEVNGEFITIEKPFYTPIELYDVAEAASDFYRDEIAAIGMGLGNVVSNNNDVDTESSSDDEKDQQAWLKAAMPYMTTRSLIAGSGQKITNVLIAENNPTNSMQ